MMIKFSAKGVEQMSRTAFTMIELVFVIVILGILAAVAMPKLAATRDDAKVSALAYSVGTGIQEVAAFATSKGETNDSMELMSNNFAELSKSGDANLSSDKAIIKCGKIDNCLIIDINRTTTDDILQMSLGDGAGDNMCLELQKLIDYENYPIKLRGSYVKQ
jgi:general secretion pathway protein G